MESIYARKENILEREDERMRFLVIFFFCFQNFLPTPGQLTHSQTTKFGRDRIERVY